MTIVIGVTLVLFLLLSWKFCLQIFTRWQDQVENSDYEKMKEAKFVDFVMSNERRVLDWQRTHGSKKPPIYWDPQAQEWVWITRQQKRNLRVIQ